jgi:hypothetical protein
VFFKFHASLGQAGEEFVAIFYIVQWSGLMRPCRARGTTAGHGWFIEDTARTSRSGDFSWTVIRLVTNGLHGRRRLIDGGDRMNWLHGKDGRDLIAGVVLIVIGIFCALYASQHYPLGSVSRMVPGMFPTVLGYVLAGFGVLIALPAWFRSGSLPKPEYKHLFFVLIGTLVFALTVERIGVVPAIFLLTGLAVLADNKLGIIGTLILAGALSAAAVLIFLFGLGIPIHPFVWPF